MNWRPPDREDRQVAALWAVCASLTIVLRPLWLASTKILPACPWRQWTGWPCPGCGTTRTIVRLLHADVLGALSINPLAACASVVFVTGGLAAPFWFDFGGGAPAFSAQPKPRSLALLAAGFLANWAWLVASGV